MNPPKAIKTASVNLLCLHISNFFIMQYFPFSSLKPFLFGGFKYEVQHGLMRREIPRGVS